MYLSIRNDQCQRSKKVQNSKVVNSVKISQVQSMDEIVKDPSDHAEVGADDAEDADRTKRNTGIPCVFQQTQTTMRRLTMNSREQHPRKRCQMRWREFEGSTRHEDWTINAHMSESSSAR